MQSKIHKSHDKMPISCVLDWPIKLLEDKHDFCYLRFLRCDWILIKLLFSLLIPLSLVSDEIFTLRVFGAWHSPGHWQLDNLPSHGMLSHLLGQNCNICTFFERRPFTFPAIALHCWHRQYFYQTYVLSEFDTLNMNINAMFAISCCC